jgi:hypothetical protein
MNKIWRIYSDIINVVNMSGLFACLFGTVDRQKAPDGEFASITVLTLSFLKVGHLLPITFKCSFI